MIRIALLSAGLAVGFAGVGAATAATVSYTHNDIAGAYTIERFDPSLGVLTGVKIDLQSEYDASVLVNSYDDDGWVPARFDYSVAIDRTIPFGTLSLLVSYVGAGSIDLPTETMWTGFSIARSASKAFSGADMSYFVGTDSFDPRERETRTINGNLVPSADSYSYWSWDDSYFFDNFKITYTYTPDGAGAVPEPASWAMMLVGFGGIGYAVRRRRRVAISFN
jgi:hypothetical protein